MSPCLLHLFIQLYCRCYVYINILEQEFSQANNFSFFCSSVDGIWSSWNEWTNCTLDTSGGCGTNDKVFRNRTCTNPEPQIGGHFCPGRDVMSSYLSESSKSDYTFTEFINQANS